MHIMLSSFAAVLASSPKKRNLYPTSTTSTVSLCFFFILTTCVSRGVSFEPFFPPAATLLPPFFKDGAAPSSSSSSPPSCPSSSNAAVSSVICQLRRLICAMLSGCTSFFTNFACNCSLRDLVVGSSSSRSFDWLEQLYRYFSVRDDAL